MDFCFSFTKSVIRDGLFRSWNGKMELMEMGERLQLPLPNGPVEVAIVLVGVSHPGNLGAICRCMLNYGFNDLRLVQPSCSPNDAEARARSKHAVSVLEQAASHTSIEEATLDCRAVIGTSGKREVGEKTLFRHFLYPWDMVERESTAGGRIAVVFGEEGKGLSAEDLGKCDYFVTLPTWEGYPIANLSHAVNALVYEIHRSRVITSQGKDPALPAIVPLSTAMEPAVRHAMLKALNQFSTALTGAEERRVSVEQTFRRTIMKGTPSTQEVTRMIGALVEATTALEHAQGSDEWKKEHRRRLR